MPPPTPTPPPSPAGGGRRDYFSPYSADRSFIAVAADGKQEAEYGGAAPENLRRDRGVNQMVWQ